MVVRTVKIAFFVSMASFACLGSDSIAQDKREQKTKPAAPKSADHATTGNENEAGDGSGPNVKQTTIWPGMTRAGTVLLPNGWSLKPAGRQSKLGDLPVQIAVHPTAPILAILHAGYGEHEIVTVDGPTGRVIARVSLPFSFAGLVWSADGKRIFAGGGFDDRIYRFDHAEGLLSNKKLFEYPDRKEFQAQPNPEYGEKGKKYQRLPAGLALTKDGSRRGP
jgi:hypothetical protein